MSYGFDNASRVMSGTWGEAWMDGDYVAEITSAQAKVTADKETIARCRHMMQDTKLMSTKGTGSLSMHKVNSRMADKIADNLRRGKDTRMTIILKLDDPDAYGAERVALYNCSFDDLTLADWAVGKNGSVTAPFTFNDFEFLDKVSG